MWDTLAAVRMRLDRVVGLAGLQAVLELAEHAVVHVAQGRGGGGRRGRGAPGSALGYLASRIARGSGEWMIARQVAALR